MNGNHVRWDNWEFRFSFNIREGLVLHQIGYDDRGEMRSICYRAALSEMLVPYADTSRAWLWREFYDQGEYGLGLLSTSMRAGKELPDNAITFDAVLADESAGVLTGYEDRVFMVERDGGGLLLHSQSSQGSDSRIRARAKELVVGFTATLGNYDYVYQWVFRQDATFGFESELHGLILTKTVDLKRCGICAAASSGGPGKTYEPQDAERFGTLVQENTLGISHQHWFNLRLDFDIDGPVNAVKECEVRRLPPDSVNNPETRAFMATHKIFATEKEATRDLDFDSKRNWVIFNPEKKSALGHPTGFEILPGANSQSVFPESRSGEKIAFTRHHFWVTRYNLAEMYAAGEFVNQAGADYRDHLGNWAGEENIFKEDIVVWYSLAYTHVAKPEDYPIMPAGRISVTFAPKGFFERSPTLGLATLERKSKKE